MSKNLKILIMAMCLYGCATPLSLNNSSSLVSKFGYSDSDIVDLSYCNITGFGPAIGGVCLLSQNELLIYRSDDIKEAINKTQVHKLPFSDIKGIGFITYGLNRQIQLKSTLRNYGITITPNGVTIDQDKNKFWFDFMIGKGIDRFEPEEFEFGDQPKIKYVY